MDQFFANHLDAIICAVAGFITGGFSVRLFNKKNSDNANTNQTKINAGGDVAGRDIKK